MTQVEEKKKGEVLLTVEDVVYLTTLSKSSIRRLELLGKFPNRTKLPNNRVGWLYPELISWIDSLPTGVTI